MELSKTRNIQIAMHLNRNGSDIVNRFKKNKDRGIFIAICKVLHEGEGSIAEPLLLFALDIWENTDDDNGDNGNNNNNDNDNYGENEFKKLIEMIYGCYQCSKTSKIKPSMIPKMVKLVCKKTNNYKNHENVRDLRKVNTFLKYFASQNNDYATHGNGRNFNTLRAIEHYRVSVYACLESFITLPFGLDLLNEHYKNTLDIIKYNSTIK